ncbi:MAG: NBR1-Ig-like domain-containing protein [Anaerolineaceae bacterium]|nr:NBR1-Ig-like domain-containing protein [Anaerolineaceae bacterium]
MLKNILRITTILIMPVILIITGCTSKDAQEPTLDPDAIYTAAAQTVEAQLTQAAEQSIPPTNTSLPPTEEPATPTSESPAGTTAQPPIGGTPVGPPQEQTPGQPVISTSTPFTLATLTSTLPAPSSMKYELLSQNPADDTIMAAERSFDMVWEIKNTGTTTWTELFTIEFFLGDRIGGGRYTQNSYFFREPVLPGESTFVYVDMRTPITHGEYYSWWKLKDELGANFGDVSVNIIVGEVLPE